MSTAVVPYLLVGSYRYSCSTAVCCSAAHAQQSCCCCCCQPQQLQLRAATETTMARPAASRTWVLACCLACLVSHAHPKQTKTSIDIDWTKRAVLHQLVAANMREEVQAMIDGHKGKAKRGQKNILVDTPDEREKMVRRVACSAL